MSKRNSISQVPLCSESFGPVMAMQLPNVPQLTVVSSVSATLEGSISATGISSNLQMARVLHDSERAERLAVAANPAEPGIYGVAAGTDGMASVLRRALCELIERRLCLSWWSDSEDVKGHMPAPSVTVEFDRARKIWPRLSERKTGLLQLETEGLPPVLVAWSCDASGRSLCFGASCQSDARGAVIHALFELYQMEFGLDLERYRVAHGIQPSPAAARLLERAEHLTLAKLQPKLQPSLHALGWPAKDPVTMVSGSGLGWEARHISRDPDVVQVVCTSNQLAVTDLGWSFYVRDCR